jgi:hypothetical protein
MIRWVRYDAPFWAVLLLGLLSVGSLGCFGIAAAQMNHRGSEPEAEIMTTDDCPPPEDL